MTTLQDLSSLLGDSSKGAETTITKKVGDNTISIKSGKESSGFQDLAQKLGMEETTATEDTQNVTDTSQLNLREQAIENLTKGRGLLGRFISPTEVEIAEEIGRITQARNAAITAENPNAVVSNERVTQLGGRTLQNEVTVPAGADKFQGSPFYDLVSDDKFTGFRTYRIKPGLDDIYGQGTGRSTEQEQFGDRAAWQAEQQRLHDAEQADAQARGGHITGQFPTRTESQYQAEVDQLVRDRYNAEAQAAGGRIREEAEAAAREDALRRASETAARETNVEFQYRAGEQYNAPSKQVAHQWVSAGIVAPGAIFVLPSGVTGRAQ